MRQFPKTQLRTLQFDSFFIENVKKFQDTKGINLLPEEAYWLYHSEGKLHEFVRRATLDCKIAILAKLGVPYSITVFDTLCGCDLPKWSEQFRAAKGLESAMEYFIEGGNSYVHYSHSFVIADLEVQRVLNRLSMLYHGKLMPLSRYIKRLRDYKKLASYENLLKENDFIYFFLKICLGFGLVSAKDNALDLDKKELAILIVMYLEHRAMGAIEVRDIIDKITPSYKTQTAMEKLRKQGLIDRTAHPYNRGKDTKKYLYLITGEGQAKVILICNKILSYL